MRNLPVFAIALVVVAGFAVLDHANSEPQSNLWTIFWGTGASLELLRASIIPTVHDGILRLRFDLVDQSKSLRFLVPYFASMALVEPRLTVVVHDKGADQLVDTVADHRIPHAVDKAAHAAGSGSASDEGEAAARKDGPIIHWLRAQEARRERHGLPLQAREPRDAAGRHRIAGGADLFKGARDKKVSGRTHRHWLEIGHTPRDATGRHAP